MKNEIHIQDRKIGLSYKPFVIAEIGINHEGSMKRAKQMIDDAMHAGCECVKFQIHVIEDEMIPNTVKPGHTKETIWEIMNRCKFSEEQDRELKNYVESKGMIYLATPFSRAAADRLHRMNVGAYKIGSGECNNYPLLEHIASFGKPIILSTGMNNIPSIQKSVNILRKFRISYALLHCTSMYPTPYDKMRLGSLRELQTRFPDAVIGLSDHSVGIYTSLAAIGLGASIIEKHFTSDKRWKGPDIPLSISPQELHELVIGTDAIHKALGGSKTILKEEKPTIDFAYACVVSIRPIIKGELLTSANIWVKRPGTGEIMAVDFPKVIGKTARRNIPNNFQIQWSDFKR